MNTIIIKDLFSTALSEANGITLRQKIEEVIPNLKEEELIYIDFQDIRLYASPFFNACISYLVEKYTPNFVEKKLQLNNMTDLGQKTYDRSYNNALRNYQNDKKNDEVIGKIIQKNIQDS